jgi:hypothetical protein
MIILSISHVSQAERTFPNKLTPFTTDGCSVIPDVGQTDCCVDHDYAYWLGGEEDLKDKADEELRSCVAENSNAALGEIFYRGVRVGGGPDTKNTYRWGYGWVHQRSFRPISFEEELMISILDPVNYKDIPVSDPVQTLIPIPSENNNYCIDNILDFIENFYQSETIPNDEIHLREDSRSFRTKVEVSIDNREESFLFKFKTRAWKGCQKPRYHEVLPNLYYDVTIK